ncbi:MAG: hypothetical protein GVY19_02375 [Bacteroidetes bacterium]|jgi:hypothetical protein|nr:hypothetical protein [Bacteroidota bacterium]
MKILLTSIFITVLSSFAFSQSVELKYNLDKDKTYKVKSSSIQDQTVTMQGMERKSETRSISYFSLKMLDPKPDFFIAEVKFDTLKTTISMPPMELTSAKKGDINSEEVGEVSNCILNRLSNSTLVVRMDYTGHVQEIMNHRVIKETVLAGTDSLKGQAAMAKGQLEMIASKDALIGMIEGVTAYLPNKEVKKGDSWESSFISKNGGVGMNISSNLKLKEFFKKNAVIEGDVVAEPESSEPTVMNGAEITNELRGLGKSTIEIDPETGWIISSSSKIQLSGNMHIKAQGQNMTMPVESIITGESMVIE